MPEEDKVPTTEELLRRNVPDAAIISTRRGERNVRRLMDTFTRIQGERRQEDERQQIDAERRAAIPPPPETGLTAEEAQILGGGDLTGFTVDEKTQSFVPTTPIASDQGKLIQARRRFEASVDNTMNTLRKVRTNITLRNRLMELYEERARIMRGFIR